MISIYTLYSINSLLQYVKGCRHQLPRPITCSYLFAAAPTLSNISSGAIDSVCMREWPADGDSRSWIEGTRSERRSLPVNTVRLNLAFLVAQTACTIHCTTPRFHPNQYLYCTIQCIRLQRFVNYLDVISQIGLLYNKNYSL